MSRDKTLSSLNTRDNNMTNNALLVTFFKCNKSLVSRFLRRKHLLLVAVVLTTVAFIAFNALNNESNVNPKSQSRDSEKNSNRAKHTGERLSQPSPAPPLPSQSVDTSKPYVARKRLVHIDLKGAPPKLEFYRKLFPLLASLGANALLLEYEDMFPFGGLLAPVSALNAYTHSQVEQLLSLAHQNHLEVIPLIQTFGHLEFVLKLEPFARFREVSHLPQAMCPTRNGSFALIEAMVDQVLALHPRARYLHIGCDEVFHLGYCETCRAQDRDSLFLNHVYRVAEYVVRAHKVIPIVWDDMLRQIPSERIKESRIADIGVEPMIWTYIKDIYRFIPFSQFIQFSQLFPHVWTASAFKGAFGETLTVPNVRMHLENNMAWIDVMREQEKNFKEIRGIAITGWQRYDHLATLCELLPAALPSLALNLLTVTSGQFEAKHVFQEFDRIMSCNSRMSSGREPSLDMFESDPYLFDRTQTCLFPASNVYRLMETHAETIKRVNDYLYDVTVHKAWLTDYNVRHNISSPFRVDEGLQEYSSVYYSLQTLLRTAKEALQQVYDKYTTFEWLEENVYPYLLKMETLLNNSLALKRSNSWPKRPLPVLEDLERRVKRDNL